VLRVRCETVCLCIGTDVWWGACLHLISVRLGHGTMQNVSERDNAERLELLLLP